MPNILDVAIAAETECHDTTFRDCEEMLTKCIDRLSADLPFMESKARERIVDLCFVYTRTYYTERE